MRVREAVRFAGVSGVSGGVVVGIVGLVLVALFFGAVLAVHEWDAGAFIMIGSRFQEGDLEGQFGYDGQFAYYIASDPLKAAGQIDHPAYRYQRILYPLLAWVLSLGGDQDLLPWAMLSINLLAAAGVCGLLGEILLTKKIPAWHALAALFSAGVLIALRADLNEPLAMLCALAGLALLYRKEPVWAGLAFALGVLAKETALPFVLGAAAWLFSQRRFQAGGQLLATSLLPAVLWGAFLAAWLGQSPLSADQATMEVLPFYGLIFIGVSPAKAIILLWVALPAILFTLVGMYDFLKREWSPELFVLLANVALIAFMPRLTWYNAAGALRAATGLAMLSLVYVAFRRPRLLPWVGAFWITSGLVMIPTLVLGPFVN